MPDDIAISHHPIGIGGIQDSRPNKWAYPQKKINYTSARSYQTLGAGGFREFYMKDDTIDRFSDTVRRHYKDQTSAEAEWKRTIRTLPVLVPPVPIEKPSRVKLITRQDLDENKEFVQRGKMRVRVTNDSGDHNLSDCNTILGLKQVLDSEGNRLAERKGIELPFEKALHRKRLSSTSSRRRQDIRHLREYTEKENLVCPTLVHHQPTILLRPVKPNILSEEFNPFDPRKTKLDERLLHEKKKLEQEKETRKDAQMVKDLDLWLPPAIAEQKEMERKKEEELKLQQALKKKKGINKLSVPKGGRKSGTSSKKNTARKK